MKRQTVEHTISITLTRRVQLEERELRFLRAMAQHCIKTRLAGLIACERLDALLDDMGIAVYDTASDGPVYDIFDDR